MIINLYKIIDYNEYLINSEIKVKEIKDSSIKNKMLKFNNEYKFLNNNIRYSIETSVIVSNYLEGLK